jgi:hypothetical protein
MKCLDGRARWARPIFADFGRDEKMFREEISKNVLTNAGERWNRLDLPPISTDGSVGRDFYDPQAEPECFALQFWMVNSRHAARFFSYL